MLGGEREEVIRKFENWQICKLGRVSNSSEISRGKHCDIGKARRHLKH